MLTEVGGSLGTTVNYICIFNLDKEKLTELLILYMEKEYKFKIEKKKN